MVRNIVQITLGEDINDELIEFNMKDSNGGFTLRGVKLSQAMKECIDQLGSSYPGKLLNPLHMLGLISLEPNLTPY